MRFAVCLFAIAVAFSGCASEDAPEEAQDLPPAEGNITLPDPLQWSGSLKAVATPAGTTTGCELDDGCVTHTFDVEHELGVEILLKSLDGTVTGATATVFYGSDYDMTLRDASGRELGTSTNPDTEDDVIEVRLAPGSYAIDIVAWNDQDGRYELSVTFSA